MEKQLKEFTGLRARFTKLKWPVVASLIGFLSFAKEFHFAGSFP